MNLISIFKTVITGASILSPIAILVFSTVQNVQNVFWDISLYTVFILMCIRPLNDLFPSLQMYKFMPLRKHLGILSSIIVVTFAVIHYVSIWDTFLVEYFSVAYWSFSNGLFFAHMGELTGLILLLTSNMFSMKLLKQNWKKVQKLSYVYFFSGALYVFMAFGKVFGFIAILIVFELTLAAYIKKRVHFVEPEVVES